MAALSRGRTTGRVSGFLAPAPTFPSPRSEALGCIGEEVGHRLRELAEALALEVVGPAAGRA